MASKMNTIDWGGLILEVKELRLGHDNPQSAQVLRKPFTATASITRADFAERRIVVTTTAAATATLPAATGSGAGYMFLVNSIAGGNFLISTAGTDIMVGMLVKVDVDTTDTITAEYAVTADAIDDLTFTGTTAGEEGTWVELVDIASGVWAVRGNVGCSGTPATVMS